MGSIIAICFGQFGPYHHARVAALQAAVRPMADGGERIDGGTVSSRSVATPADAGDGVPPGGRRAWRVIPVQIAAATTTYAWKASDNATTGPRALGPKAEGGDAVYREEGRSKIGDDDSTLRNPHSAIAEGLQTLCTGMEETVSPVAVFWKARRLFKAEHVEIAFLPSYSPARYFALFAAAKSLGLRTIMMNESHADFKASGLKASSLIRLGYLAVLPADHFLGAIGSIAPTRHSRLLSRLSEFLAP